MWTFLDTGLRLGEFSSLSRDNIDWQAHRLMICGKGGPNGTKSKRRMIPLTARVQPLIAGHFASRDAFGMGDRTIQRIVKRVANRARISRAAHPLSDRRPALRRYPIGGCPGGGPQASYPGLTRSMARRSASQLWRAASPS